MKSMTYLEFLFFSSVFFQEHSLKGNAGVENSLGCRMNQDTCHLMRESIRTLCASRCLSQICDWERGLQSCQQGFCPRVITEDFFFFGLCLFGVLDWHSEPALCFKSIKHPSSQMGVNSFVCVALKWKKMRLLAMTAE